MNDGEKEVERVGDGEREGGRGREGVGSKYQVGHRGRV